MQTLNMTLDMKDTRDKDIVGFSMSCLDMHTVDTKDMTGTLCMTLDMIATRHDCHV